MSKVLNPTSLLEQQFPKLSVKIVQHDPGFSKGSLDSNIHHKTRVWKDLIYNVGVC